MNPNFVSIVQSAMRTLAVCPACGRRITREEGVRVRGERYHRACAYYRADVGNDR